MIRRTPARLRAFDLALRVAGARRLLPTFLKRRLLGIGIHPEEVDPLLERIRSLEQWTDVWQARARLALTHARDASKSDLPAARLEVRLALGASLLGLALTDPLSNRRRAGQDDIRRAYRLLAGFGPGTCEAVELSWESRPVHGFLRSPPGPGPHPLLILLPALGHTKEELGIAFEPLARDGYALAGLDLPGFGESAGPLPLDAEKVLRRALDGLLQRPEIEPGRVAVIGISLGAYWGFKLAASDRRLRLAVGISTPVMSSRQWRRLPPHLWRAFEGAFATSDSGRARHLAMQLTLEGVFQRLHCPALLFHGGKDAIPIPEVIPWLLSRSRVPVEAEIYPRARHGCIDHIEDRIVPALREKLARGLAPSGPGSRAADCRRPVHGAAAARGATFSTHTV